MLSGHSAIRSTAKFIKLTPNTQRTMSNKGLSPLQLVSQHIEEALSLGRDELNKPCGFLDDHAIARLQFLADLAVYGEIDIVRDRGKRHFNAGFRRQNQRAIRQRMR